jgi:hypothetical protein
MDRWMNLNCTNLWIIWTAAHQVDELTNHSFVWFNIRYNHILYLGLSVVYCCFTGTLDGLRECCLNSRWLDEFSSITNLIIMTWQKSYLPLKDKVHIEILTLDSRVIVTLKKYLKMLSLNSRSKDACLTQMLVPKCHSDIHFQCSSTTYAFGRSKC